MTKRKAEQLTPNFSESRKRYQWNPEILLTNNRYNVLSQINEDSAEDTNDGCKQTTSKTGQINEKSEKEKIPPLFLHEAGNYKEVLKDIRLKTKKEFTTKIINKYLKINLSCSEDYISHLPKPQRETSLGSR